MELVGRLTPLSRAGGTGITVGVVLETDEKQMLFMVSILQPHGDNSVLISPEAPE